MSDHESSPSDADNAVPSLIRRIPLIALVGVLVLLGADLVMDSSSGAAWSHLLLEAAAMLAALAGVGVLLLQNRRARAAAVQASLQARTWEAEAIRWRADAEEAMRGLGAALEEQFRRWSLSPAESEVALLLLKGLSMKEIAAVRGVSERTVRQQARAVYAKAGLSGRAELSAFFLEELLLPGT